MVPGRVRDERKSKMSATIPTQAKGGLESGTFQLPPCTSGVDFCATRVHGRRILSEAFGAFDGEKYGPLAQSQSRCFGHAGSHASKRRLAGYFGAQPHSGKIRNRDGPVWSLRHLLPSYEGAGRGTDPVVSKKLPRRTGNLCHRRWTQGRSASGH